MAFGPALYGVLRETPGGYEPALAIAAVINLVAAGISFWGGRKPLPAPN